MSPFTSSPNLSIGPAPYGVTALDSVASGYSTTICYQCTVTSQDGTKTVFHKDNLVIEAAGSICSSVMSDALFAPATYPYNPTGSAFSLIREESDVFTIALKPECSITSCSLKEAKCGIDFSSSSNVNFDAATNGVTALDSVAAGYTVSFCY